MKKYFIMALVAITTIGMVGCKKKDDPTGGKVVVSPKSLEIAVGEQQKVRASVEPAKEGVTFAFASSNADVATVAKDGTVTGVATGTANIIVTAEGYTADTCVLTVVDPLDVFAWGGMGLVKVDKTQKFGDEYLLQDTYKCQNYLGTWYIWDQDITYTDNVGLSGAGYVAVVKCPTAIITEGQYAGQYATWELNFDNTLSADSSGVCEEGSLTDAAEWGKFITDSTYTGDGSFKGSPIHYYDWDDETGENDYYFVGYIKDGWIGDYSNGFFYDMNINWFDMEQGLYGLKMEQGEDGKWYFVQPFTFTDIIAKNYKLYPEKSSLQHAKPLKVMNFSKKQQTKRLNDQQMKGLRIAK